MDMVFIELALVLGLLQSGGHPSKADPALLDQIRALATYVQFGEMEKFVENMQAARFLPHTDASRYPSVMQKLRERGKTFPPGKLAAERSGAD